MPLVLDDCPKVPMHTNNELRSEMNVVELENTAIYSFIPSLKHEPQGISTVFVISLIKVPLHLSMSSSSHEVMNI